MNKEHEWSDQQIISETVVTCCGQLRKEVTRRYMTIAELPELKAAREEIPRLQDRYDMQSKELLKVTQENDRLRARIVELELANKDYEDANKYLIADCDRMDERRNMAEERAKELELEDGQLRQQLAICYAERKSLENAMDRRTCRIDSLRRELIEKCNHVDAATNTILQWVISGLRGL